MPKLPDGTVKYATSPTFSDLNVPETLTRIHTTKTGVWARLIVDEGELIYTSIRDNYAVRLVAGEHHIIEPQEEHFVELEDCTQFYLEFFKFPVLDNLQWIETDKKRA